MREFLKEKRGHGWNDEQQEVHVTERELEEMNAFMEPIRAHFREVDLAREQELEKKRAEALAALRDREKKKIQIAPVAPA